jgi:outer membrane translocation and assembly module TamA
MRRATILASATALAIGALAMGAIGAAAETIVKKKVFETTVSAAFTQTTPAGGEYVNPSGRFDGKVSSPKKKCVKNRTVVVKAPTGPNVGQSTSNDAGDWTAQGNNLTPGQYRVEVEKNKIIKEKDKPNGTHVKKKIVCQPVTATISIP